MVDRLVWAQELLCLQDGCVLTVKDDRIRALGATLILHDKAEFCLPALYGANKTACSVCALKYGVDMQV
jgi:hypothetical protein